MMTAALLSRVELVTHDAVVGLAASHYPPESKTSLEMSPESTADASSLRIGTRRTRIARQAPLGFHPQ